METKQRPHVIYICDRKQDCKGSPYCGDPCTHTTDISHARNFRKMTEVSDGDYYFETNEKGDGR